MVNRTSGTHKSQYMLNIFYIDTRCYSLWSPVKITKTKTVMDLPGAPTHLCVCSLFTFNRSFYPSTSSTTIDRYDSSILEEIQVLWSQSYATEILRCHVCSKSCSAVENAMPCHDTRYDRHDIDNLWTRETERNNRRENRNKVDKSEEKNKKKKINKQTNKQTNVSRRTPSSESSSENNNNNNL